MAPLLHRAAITMGFEMLPEFQVIDAAVDNEQEPKDRLM